jgi:hypothetical protein
MSTSERASLIREAVSADPLRAYSIALGCDAGNFRKKGTEYYTVAPCHRDREPSLRIRAGVIAFFFEVLSSEITQT